MNDEERAYFSAAWDKYADAVFRLGMVWLNNRADAEDMTADLFVKLMQRPRPAFESDEHEKAFFIRSAINLCKDSLRKRKRRRAEENEGLKEYASSAEEIGLAEEILALPPRYRAVIYLHYCQGYKTAEVAKMLGLREGTVRSQLARGRENLRRRLEEGGVKLV